MRKTFFLFLMLFASLGMAKPKYLVVAYVTSWTNEKPDPNVMTHINYAFGKVNATFDGVTVDRPERLKEMVKLKSINPKLHVILSIGGWGAGGFSEMAADEHLRMSFAKDCRRVIEEYGLDGVDIDWEFPTKDWAKISASPDDTDNYTLMMRDIRKAIGKKKELTLASTNTADFINFPEVMPYLDFVNIMAYDMGGGSKHHSSLYQSDISGYCTCEMAVKKHLDAGIPMNKLVLGMPFYSHGIEGFETVNPEDIEKKGLVECWDTKGCVPYLMNKEGTVVTTYDNELSVTIKCKYIKQMGMLGGMYWRYEDGKHEMSKVLAKELMR